jgi:autoinducer 2-degrading protein
VRPSLRRPIAAALIALATAAIADAQNDPTVYVVSYVEAVPASQRQIAAMLRQYADASRGEGAMRFEVLQQTGAVNQFIILETWKNQQALDRHAAAPHSATFRDAVAPLLAAPIDARLCVATIAATPSGDRAGMYAVTHVDVPNANRDEAITALRTVVEQARKDPGNLRFDVVHQPGRTNHFTVIAAWKDEKSQSDHQLAPHTREFRRRINPLLGALYDQRWYKPL